LKIKRIQRKYKIGLLLLVLLTVLYFLLKESLPHYAARVPLLGMYLILEYLVFNFIRDTRPLLTKKFKGFLIVLWWLPVVLMVVFLIFASYFPLQDWNKYLKIYLPGVGIMALLAKTVLFIFLLIPLLLEIFRKLFHRKASPSGTYIYIVKFLKRMAIILGSLAFFGLFIGSIHWVSKFKTREVDVSIDDLPESLNGLRIVQLSDIHLGSWANNEPMERAVAIVNDLQPDLVLFTGDMVNYSSNETKGFETILGKINAKMGVYAILGNHDYGDYVPWPDSIAKANDLQKLEAFYEKIGWKLLRNENTVININGSTILLAGVENWSATSRFHRYGDMKRTMNDAPDTDVSILMSHDPTHWEAEIVKEYSRFDLTLAGHTHGMQMGFQGLGIRWSPSQYIFKNWGGMYQKELGNQQVSRLYVNLGLGHIGYPGRLGILPEITLITLTD